MTSVHRPQLLRLACAVTTLVVAATPAARGQTWRTVTAARQRGTADTLRVHVVLAAGTVQVAATTRPVLYDLSVRFNAERGRPIQRYDAATQTLVVRSDSVSYDPLSFNLRRGGWRLDGNDNEKQGTTLSLGLAPGIPLDLVFALGACRTTLDLSRLAVHRLRLRTGASESTITFGTPNPIAMTSLDIAIGAANLTVLSLGNAHADTVAVSTGVGSADLDLSGQWTGTMHLTVKAALGGVTLRVPADVGIEARATTKLGSFDAAGLTARDGAYYSANWGSAARRVTIDARATLANVQITRP